MAEFQEVCRQAIRRAKWVGGALPPKILVLTLSCTGETERGDRPGQVATTPEEMEKRIMGWAAEHPEKSMKDILLERFPNALVYNDEPETCAEFLGFGPCPNKDGHMSCKECWNRPAPEEVETK